MKLLKEIVVVTIVIIMLLNILNFFFIVTITGKVTSDSLASLCIYGDPSISSIPNQGATVGTEFSFQVNCTLGCDQGANSYGGTAVPTLNSFFINTSTGLINFTPGSGEETNSPYTVVVLCQRKGLTTDTESFQLNVNPATTIPYPDQLNCSLNQDNSSADLIWSSVSGSTRYTIYHSSNISQIVNLSLSNIGAEVTQFNVTDSNWTDSTANQELKRYYTVSATTSAGVALTNDTVCGKFTYQFDVPVSDTYGKLASNYLSFYLDNNYTAEAFLQELPSYLNSTLSILEKSDASGEFLKTHVRGLSDGNDFNIVETEGYLLTVDNNFNHTIIKDVKPEPYNISYTIFLSSSKGKLATNWRGIYDYNKTHTAESLLQEIPSLYNSTASILQKTNGNGEFLKTHVRGLSDGNDFDIELGKGYIFTLDANYTQTSCTRCFD